MPASKRVSTRSQSPTSSSQDGGNVPAKATTGSASLPIGERISTRGWTMESLLELGNSKFSPVKRISVRRLSTTQIVEIVREYEELGSPLILEEWHLRRDWNKTVLNVDYLVERLPNQGRPCLLSSRTYS